MALSLFLMSFGLSYASESYDNLVGFVKEANFLEFKKQFEKGLITSEQKQELLKLANEVIDKEYKYWRLYRSPENIVRKEQRNVIKVSKILTAIFGGVPFALAPLYCLKIFFERRKDYLRDLQGLWRQPPATLQTIIDAQGNTSQMIEANLLKRANDFWFFNKFIPAFMLSCGSFILCGLFFGSVKHNQKVLRSFKRWEKVTKIKKLIELNMQGI